MYPLGDAVTQGDGPLHGGVLLHTAIYEVILIIGELGKKKPIRTGPLVVREIPEARHFCLLVVQLMLRDRGAPGPPLACLPLDETGGKEIFLILPRAWFLYTKSH